MLLFLSIVLIIACSGLPLSRIGDQGVSVPPPDLTRCGAAPTAFCIVTFSLDVPGRMLIVLFVPAGSPTDFQLVVDYKGVQSAYPCQLTSDSPTTFNCAGAEIPLGDAITVDIFTADGSEVLAHGEFVVTAFALPTVSMEEGDSSTPDLFGSGNEGLTTPSARRTPSIHLTPTVGHPTATSTVRWYFPTP
jgi:hypothetical protein